MTAEHCESVEHDTDLSLAAVGLWHLIRVRIGENFTASDLLLVQPNAMSWHPQADLEDMNPPLDELIANGWVEKLAGDRYQLAGWCTDGT